MERFRAVLVAGVVALWCASCTGLGESDCSRDEDCPVGEQCVVGLCTPGDGAVTSGDGPGPGGDTERGESTGPMDSDERVTSGADSSDDPDGAGDTVSDADAPTDQGSAGDQDTGAGGSDSGTDADDGSGESDGSDDSDNGSDANGSDGSDEIPDPCGDEPTADVACLIPVGGEGSGETTICASMRPFCGEDIVPAPAMPFAQCSEESVSRSLEHLDEEILAPIFRDERSCDGQDNNCDGRIDEQCCRVQGLRPEPIVLPSECVVAFGPEGPGQQMATEDLDDARRVLMDVTTVGPEDELVLTWLSMVRMPGSGVWTMRLLRDRVDGLTGVATEREVWVDEGEDAFALSILAPLGSGSLLVGVTRQGELGAARVNPEAETLQPVILTVEGFDELELQQFVPLTHTTADGGDRIFLALLVVIEGTVDEPVETRWELVEASLDDTTLSIEGASRLPLVFSDQEAGEHVPWVALDAWFPFSLFTSPDGNLHARWCWQDADREREEVTCYSVVDPLGIDDQGPREVTEIRSFEGAVRWWRRPAPNSRWLPGVIDRNVDGDSPGATVVLLDLDDEDFVFGTINGLGGEPPWQIPVGMFDLDGELHMSVYWNELTRLAKVDPAGAVRQELLTVAYYSTVSESQRVLDGFWRAETSVVAGDTRWVVVERTLEEEACAPGASTYALLPFTLDGQRLCLEEQEAEEPEGE